MVVDDFSRRSKTPVHQDGSFQYRPSTNTLLGTRTKNQHTAPIALRISKSCPSVETHYFFPCNDRFVFQVLSDFGFAIAAT